MLELPVGEQMLDALVRAISLLDLAVAIAKLSTRSLLSSPVWSSTTYGHIGASNYWGEFPSFWQFQPFRKGVILCPITDLILVKAC